jgi:hypothetical protein
VSPIRGDRVTVPPPQRTHVGMIHARKIVTVTAADHSFRLDIDGETVGIVARTTTGEIYRYKAYATKTRSEDRY